MGAPDVRDGRTPETDRDISEAWRAVLSLHGDDDLGDDYLGDDELGDDELGVGGGWGGIEVGGVASGRDRGERA